MLILQYQIDNNNGIVVVVVVYCLLDEVFINIASIPIQPRFIRLYDKLSHFLKMLSHNC
jgi:hypothetical protein